MYVYIYIYIYIYIQGLLQKYMAWLRKEHGPEIATKHFRPDCCERLPIECQEISREVFRTWFEIPVSPNSPTDSTHVALLSLGPYLFHNITRVTAAPGVHV